MTGLVLYIARRERLTAALSPKLAAAAHGRGKPTTSIKTYIKLSTSFSERAKLSSSWDEAPVRRFVVRQTMFSPSFVVNPKSMSVKAVEPSAEVAITMLSRVTSP